MKCLIDCFPNPICKFGSLIKLNVLVYVGTVFILALQLFICLFIVLPFVRLEYDNVRVLFESRQCLTFFSGNI